MNPRHFAVKAIVPWLLPAGLIAAWQILSMSRIIPERILPAPLEVVHATISLTASGELPRYFRESLERAGLGLLVGGGVGFVLGVLNGLFRWAELAFDTSLQMARNIPNIAMIPLAILWFGIGEQSKLFLIALGVVFPIYLSTFHGIRGIDPRLLEMSRVYGVDGWHLVRHILLPGALPSILTGMRFALGVMWVTLIVAETIATDNGIGYMINQAREFMQTDLIVLGIILYALLGKLADAAARFFEGRCLAWHPSQKFATSGAWT